MLDPTKIAAVHVTDHHPAKVFGGEPLAIHSRGQYEHDEIFFPTVHFSLQNEVPPHMTASWDNKKYVIVTPYQEIVDRYGEPEAMLAEDSFWTVEGEEPFVLNGAILVEPNEKTMPEGRLYYRDGTSVFYKSSDYVDSDWLLVKGLLEGAVDRGEASPYILERFEKTYQLGKETIHNYLARGRTRKDVSPLSFYVRYLATHEAIRALDMVPDNIEQHDYFGNYYGHNPYKEYADAHGLVALPHSLTDYNLLWSASSVYMRALNALVYEDVALDEIIEVRILSYPFQERFPNVSSRDIVEAIGDGTFYKQFFEPILDNVSEKTGKQFEQFLKRNNSLLQKARAAASDKKNIELLLKEQYPLLYQTAAAVVGDELTTGLCRSVRTHFSFDGEHRMRRLINACKTEEQTRDLVECYLQAYPS